MPNQYPSNQKTGALSQDDCRYFRIGGITIRIEAGMPFSETSFHPKLSRFSADGPGDDTVQIHHRFGIPDCPKEKRGTEVYRKPPWMIYRKGESWIYTQSLQGGHNNLLSFMAVFSDDHSEGRIYHDISCRDLFREGNLASLAQMSTDEILIARLLADRNGFLIHSCGAAMDGKGLLFVGHSKAGKTTAGSFVKPSGHILCEDRNIVRRHDDGWKVYGTWSHGNLPDISPGPAPLRAVLFPEKSDCNRLVRIEDRQEIVRRTIGCLIRPFETKAWWEKIMTSIGQMVREVPCYRMQFDLSGEILNELKRL